jgi:hypothetical protein
MKDFFRPDSNFFVFFVNFVLSVECFTHLETSSEHDFIYLNEDSPFTLLRSYDLASFIKQGQRVNRLNYLKKLIHSKDILAKRESRKSKHSITNTVSNH